jgi:hypothetical protein
MMTVFRRKYFAPLTRRADEKKLHFISLFFPVAGIFRFLFTILLERKMRGRKRKSGAL